MNDTPGLLGLRPSRHFKIFREDFPAILRFNGKLYMEHYNLGEDDSSFVGVTEEEAMRWLEAKPAREPAVVGDSRTILQQHLEVERFRRDDPEGPIDSRAGGESPTYVVIRGTEGQEDLWEYYPGQGYELAARGEEKPETTVLKARRHYWGIRYDQGYHGHAYGGTRTDWINDQLKKEGLL